MNSVRALSYTPQELAENDLEILLPFQIIRMYNRVNGYNSYTEDKKDKFLRDFEKMCTDIRYTMDLLLEDKKITNDEYHEMLNITGTLKEYIYSSINDISIKGADSMLNEKVMLRDDRIRAETKAETQAEEKRKFAEMMIMNEEPAEKIEQYTGLNLSVLKPLAQSLGKTLVL